MITPEKKDALEAKFRAFKVLASDIIEKLTGPDRKSGKAEDDAIETLYLKHIPTGIEVRCRESAEPELNRFLARQMLADKIEERLTGISDRMPEFEKMRKLMARKRRKANQKW